MPRESINAKLCFARRVHPIAEQVGNIAIKKSYLYAMAGKKKNSNKTTYLTKRILVSTAKAAGTKASKEAMELMGYVVTTHNGWVVKKFADGRIEPIKRITQENISVAFD